MMAARQDPSDLRRRLREIAGLNGGFFTAADAIAAGYSYASQRYHTERGEWIRVEHGIYRLAQWPMPEHPDLIRWSLWSKGRGVVSHLSALAVHELGDFLPAAVHITLPGRSRARKPGLVLHTGSLPDEDIEVRDGFRITRPARSLLDSAALDVERDTFARAVDEAIDRGLTTEVEMRTRAEDLTPKATLAIERALGRR